MTPLDSTTKLIHPLRNGQITIPVEFRRALHLTDQTMLRMTLIGDELHLRPVQMEGVESGSNWLSELYQLFAPVRRHNANLTEETINADLDLALTPIFRLLSKPPNTQEK